MPNVARLYSELGDVYARAAEGRRQFWGQAIAGITGIPSQIIAAKQAQQHEQRKAAYDDAHLALERANFALKAGEVERADREYKLSQQLNGYENAITTAAMASGKWSDSDALQHARDLNDPRAVPIAHKLNQQNQPKLTEHDPAKALRDQTGNIVVPAQAKPLTYGTPQPAMVNGKRQMVRTASDGSLVDLQGRKVEGTDVAPDQPPMTPYQEQELGIQRQRLDIDKKKAAGEDVPVNLSPEGLDAAALQYAKSGQLPPMGMGRAAAGSRTKIINRAAELYPGLDVSSNRADLDANKATLTQLTKQRAAIGAFEETAKKNIDIFLETAGKVVDTGSPLINQPVRMLTGKILGSPDQAAFDAARQVAVNEIAKITTNPNLSGTLSDSARHEVEAFNPQNATLAQSVAVMRLLKRDMDNRTKSLDDQIKGIHQRLATKPGQAPSGVRVLKIEKVP